MTGVGWEREREKLYGTKFTPVAFKCQIFRWMELDPEFLLWWGGGGWSKVKVADKLEAHAVLRARKVARKVSNEAPSTQDHSYLMVSSATTRSISPFQQKKKKAPSLELRAAPETGSSTSSSRAIP